MFTCKTAMLCSDSVGAHYVIYASPRPLRRPSPDQRNLIRDIHVFM